MGIAKDNGTAAEHHGKLSATLMSAGSVLAGFGMASISTDFYKGLIAVVLGVAAIAIKEVWLDGVE